MRVIRSFRHAGLEKFFKTDSKAGIQVAHAAKLRVQLTALDTAKGPEDIAGFPWKLHRVKGKEQHYSIWVDKNFRLTFDFEEEDVTLLDYRDYH